MICTRCGSKLAEWHFGDEHYCQTCWESHCSEEWWRLGVWQTGMVGNEVESDICLTQI